MSKTTAVPSANWLALQKKLSKKSEKALESPRKKRKLSEELRTKTAESSTFPRDQESAAGPSKPREYITGKDDMKNEESLSVLRRMIAGDVKYSETQKLPGKYLALDCEMVGVGIDGTESSLARVTLVNYHGAVQLDEFVRQRERVVNYRTQYSGIRESDMAKAKPFDEVQKKVADLLKDRILVGHAVHNDLKARASSRRHYRITDTFAVVRSKYVALRNLVKQELDVTIQSGEHSSLTDARATMAVYRLHKKEWEKGAVGVATAMLLKTKKNSIRNDDEALSSKAKGKRKRSTESDDDESSDDDGEEDAGEESRHRQQKRQNRQMEHKKGLKYEKRVKPFPGGGRKGVSSGLSTIVHQGRRVTKGAKSASSSKSGQWWKELGGSSSGSKSSLKL
ncbi:hypothetical protein MPER_12993 [Moniliophthora perniciosa FA553]|nr:hypothetical protein MPER_12993 [Moniliophthora perniciosa FA553]